MWTVQPMKVLLYLGVHILIWTLANLKNTPSTYNGQKMEQILLGKKYTPFFICFENFI